MSFTAFSHMSTWVFAIFLMYEHMSFTKFSHMSTWVFAIFLMYEKFEDMSFRCFRMRRIWIFSHVNLRFSMRISYIFSHYFSYELHERENIVWESYEFACKLIEKSCESHMSCMWVSYENSWWEIFVRDIYCWWLHSFYNNQFMLCDFRLFKYRIWMAFLLSLRSVEIICASCLNIWNWYV